MSQLNIPHGNICNGNVIDIDIDIVIADLIGSENEPVYC